MTRPGRQALFERFAHLRGRSAEEPSPQPASEQPARTSLQVVGEEMILITPEGQRHALGLVELFAALEPFQSTARDVVAPRGARVLRNLEHGFVVAYEIPAGVHNLRWSGAQALPEARRRTSYREVRLALPNVVLVAGVRFGPDEHMLFPGQAEVYITKGPLTSTTDPLFYAPLLNVVRTSPSSETGGSLVCLNGLSLEGCGAKDPSRRLHACLAAIVGHFLHSGFNEDFERTGRLSTFNDSNAKPEDPRLATVEAWERASAENPLFVTEEIEWIPTGRTLAHALRSVSYELGLEARGAVRNGTLQRVLLNRGRRLPDDPKAAKAKRKAKP